MNRTAEHAVPVAPTTEPAPSAARRSMVVVADAPDIAIDWAPLVAEIAAVLALEPQVAADGGGARSGADRLAVAASVPGPVLLLPSRLSRRARTGRSEAGSGSQGPVAGESPALARALILSDASEEVASGARAVLTRLADVGVRSTVLHVLTEDSRPRMWEGSGHHAVAWFGELRRRHGQWADQVRVVSGNPAHEVVAHAASADVVVALWHHRASVGRARLLRALLDRALDVPVVLVPLSWTSRRATAAPPGP